MECVADWIAWGLAASARELGLFAVIGLMIGGLDDLVVDLLWMGRSLWRRLTVYSRHPRATMASLPRSPTPGRIVILIAAWRESAVIGPMLRAALAGIRHDDYLIYVGTYPNDPETADAIRAIDDPRVRIVGGTLPGPTTKAECLNRAWAAMCAEEAWSGSPVKAIVLHDAEDVIHAHELDLYDRMIDRFDLVQIPVIPLLPDGSRRRRAIAATYADEFSEAHGKMLVLREAIGASVPSAGVGCAISRAMMARIAAEGAGGAPFDPDTLTEDYELGLRVRAFGGRAAFVLLPEAPGALPVAVRAHFPETIEEAIRQKTRWITGIALAGWDRMRWDGGLAERWMRLRDRRALIAALVLAAAYLAPVPTLLCWLADVPVGWPPAMGPLLVVTTALLLWRLGMRAIMVAPVYGLREGLLAMPRVLIGNLIEMQAAARALRGYVPGRTPVWDKTEHRFPDMTPCAP